MRYKYYHYADSNGIIRIKAKRKPSLNTRPRRGTWIVQEFINGSWVMPSFPEITLGTLNKLIYLGNVLND